MYDRHWGLARPPFSRELKPDALDASPIHREALARLEFLCESRLPLGLLIGPPGTGKSAVLAEFARRADRAGYVTASISCATADEPTVLSQLAGALFLAESGTDGRAWQALVDRLAELRLEGLRTVVFCDDLDRAAPGGQSVVESLLAVASAPLTIVVSARPQTVGRIGRIICEHAALRIDLAPWSETETAEFLARSLTGPERSEPIFDAAATQQLFALSGGAPRRVRQLAELALVAGASQALAQIDEQTVCAVHDELSAVK